MSGSYNYVCLIGNVGADPYIRSTNDGRKIATLHIATSDTWKDKSSGERREKTEWHAVAIFAEGLVKVVEQYVRKGSKLMITGSLQTRKWQDKDGNDRYSTEVVLQGFGSTLVMLDGKQSEERHDMQQGNQTAQRQPDAPSFARDQLDDEVPF